MTAPRPAKDAARAQARAARDAIADSLRPLAAAGVRDRFMADVAGTAGSGAGINLPEGPIAGYWPLGSELDVRPLLLHLRSFGRPVALPVSGPRGQALTFRAWDPAVPLAAGRYGIHEPAADCPEVVPAVLLVPLLAFDRTGHRLGYGAGYYDRTLDALRAVRPVLAVGVAFAAQEVDAVPCADHDERLDWIVTEQESLRISQ